MSNIGACGDSGCIVPIEAEHPTSERDITCEDRQRGFIKATRKAMDKKNNIISRRFLWVTW
jgi:hypothetical protein